MGAAPLQLAGATITHAKVVAHPKEGAIDEWTAGLNNNGAHYVLNCIGLYTPIQLTQLTDVSANTNAAAGFRGDTLGAKRGGGMVVSGGAVTVLPPLGPTNVEGRGDGKEGAIDEQTAGHDNNGTHYDMNCIRLDMLIQSMQLTNVPPNTNAAASFRVDTLGAKRRGEAAVSRGAIAVPPLLGSTNVEGRGDGEEGAIDEQAAGCDNNGTHYDMNCIGLDTPIQST